MSEPSPHPLVAADPLAASLAFVRVVLLRPRSPGNVGSVARTMANFSLSDLRVVGLPEYDDPEFFPTESRRMAWKAAPLLEAAGYVGELGEALEGAGLVLGASHRAPRGVEVVGCREGARRLVEAAAGGAPVALVMGSEADGMRNDELARVNAVLRIDSGAGYPELNLAQATNVCAYEVYQAAREQVGAPVDDGLDLAPFEEVEALFARAREMLVEARYLDAGRADVESELRALLARARVTRRDLVLLQGVVRRVAGALARGG